MSNTDAALAAAFDEMMVLLDECETRQARVKQLLNDVRPLVIGRKVRRWPGTVYRITEVRYVWRNGLQCYGVICRDGKLGKRSFDLGTIKPADLLQEAE